MNEWLMIMRGIIKLLLLRGTQPKGSILNRRIKISGKQEKKYKKGDSSVLSMKYGK